MGTFSYAAPSLSWRESSDRPCIAWSGEPAQAQSDPPGRVGRLAFTRARSPSTTTSRATGHRPPLNTPLSTGDSLWTEPNARSEISLAGTRMRMDGATQLDMLAVDDSQTRLQLDQGRIDIKTFTMETNQPYQIVTPRGTISLQQQGDYYVEAGSPRIRPGSACAPARRKSRRPNGQVLAVRAGEVVEITGDGNAPQLHTIQTAPPPMPPIGPSATARSSTTSRRNTCRPASPATRTSTTMAPGRNDRSYGQVWMPRAVPRGWAPYSTGRWAYVQP